MDDEVFGVDGRPDLAMHNTIAAAGMAANLSDDAGLTYSLFR
ncbi:hypothetical protein [Nocardia anaemiae]|nr:hypothetical protein [Nocardia anaemiae]